MSSYLVTGANRGIGLELVRQISQLPEKEVSTVFALNRNKSDGLQKLIDGSKGRVVNVTAEITKQADVDAAVKQVESHLPKGKGLDILINNAGIMPFGAAGVANLEAGQLQQVFDVNVVSAQRVTAAFLPLLQKGQEKKIMNM